MARTVCSVDDCDRVAHGNGLCMRHYNKWRKYGDPLVHKQNQTHGLSEVDRFWSKVAVGEPASCWEWQGHRDPQSDYGRFTLKAAQGSGLRSTYIGAHRYSFQLANGPLPASSVFVCHRCDNPPCVNPAHLFAGTQSDNIRDMDSKGRRNGNQPKGEAHFRARLTDELVLELRRRAASGESDEALAAELGVSESAVRSAANGRTWKHLNDIPVPGWTVTPKKPRVPRTLVGTGTEPWHGTVSGSSWHCCGCDRCRDAIRTYRAARKAG